MTEEEEIIELLISALRPFANAADAQEHTDCEGVLTQTDWENAAQCVVAYDENIVRQKHAH